MKILVLNWRDPLHPEAGGAEVHLDHILSYLATKYQVILVSTKVFSHKEIFTHNGYEIRRIGHPFLFNFLFYFQWKSQLSKENFDIVIDDISKIGLQTPYFIKNIPILAIFHHIHGHTLFNLLPFPVACYVYILEKIALKSYTNTPIVVVSESSKKELIAFDSFRDIHILHNGISQDFLNIKKVNKKPFQFCSIGRLTKSKRVDLAILVFSHLIKEYPEAEFFIAGKGADEQRLRNYVKELSLEDSVKFLGFISERQKKQLLEESEVLLFTSEKEGWGITVIEAAACSTPTFGFDVPGVKDSVKQGVNGYLVPFEDIASMTVRIKEYLADPDKQKLQSTSYCYAKNFNWNKICLEFEILLLTLVSEHKV